jgi:predicted RNA-binding Zn-ribbon protein involved in translation (DUF1610 family)
VMTELRRELGGRCPRCGYPVLDLLTCPDCGENIWRSAGAPTVSAGESCPAAGATPAVRRGPAEIRGSC